ncbi:glycosyltransferase [Parabacteroides goldsteinii]|jgi:glycosyltransferase involved in cell wall biosynthesis|uniref:glycosyltransferase family 2 protein n=1 Tax=Parabacteroides goldsteinii TaxID=328812 RepID=UPI001CD01AD4|nr:glycosyltransferase family 2 protein [Parabacteroides goldsteinii]UBD75540.1 glycosyltransferase [Parabacteroides goldsteinii]
MGINYSFIIPHKNTPELLRRCLASIPYREDIQVIVIDDNSDPEKVDFEHFPGSGIENVQVVFSKEGKGAGAARNKGLQKASGKWLFFADADDFYNSCFLETVDRYIDSEADVIYFSVNSVYSDTLEPGFRGKEIDQMIKNAVVNRDFDQLRYKNFGPVSKMVRREFVERNRLKFDETLANNDAMFSVKCGYYAGQVVVDEAKIYCITCHISSVSHRYSEAIARDRLTVFRNINCFLRDIHKNKYRTNLIPYLLCIHNWEWRSFCRRVRLLSFGYYMSYFWIDLIVLGIFPLKLFFDRSRRTQFIDRKSLIKGRS